MSDKQFFNNLSATYADVRRLDAKKINLKGKNILEYIKEATPTIKHSQDTRETVTEDDLWGQYIEVKDGQVIVHDDWITTSSAWNDDITKVEDNKAYVGDTFYANIQTERIKDGSGMFESERRVSNLTSFTSDLSSLTNGDAMFYNSNLTTFTSDLSSLTNGDAMFSNCENLTTFDSNLSSLVDGYNMFSRTKLTSFSSNLSSLTKGSSMFAYCSQLTTFTSDLSSLVDGYNMFQNCTNFTTFEYDLSSLVDGHNMFTWCENLTTFTSDLSSLTNGLSMFARTKLTPQSVMYIAESIKNISAEKKLYTDGIIPYITVTVDPHNSKYSAPRGFMSDGKYVYTYNKYDYTINNVKPYTTIIYSSDVGKLTLGINVTNDSSTIQQQLEDFAKEATYDSWEELKQEFVDKGWTVTFQYGGTSDTISNTYDLRNGEQIIPCPIFAKLVQVEDKDTAEYCTEDASSFYNIEWGHDVTDTTDYTQFNSLEDAMASWNVFPKENIITAEE